MNAAQVQVAATALNTEAKPLAPGKTKTGSIRSKVQPRIPRAVLEEITKGST